MVELEEQPWSKASHSPIGQYKREMKARHLTVLSLGGRGAFSAFEPFEDTCKVKLSFVDVLSYFWLLQ